MRALERPELGATCRLGLCVISYVPSWPPWSCNLRACFGFPAKAASHLGPESTTCANILRLRGATPTRPSVQVINSRNAPERHLTFFFACFRCSWAGLEKYRCLRPVPDNEDDEALFGPGGAQNGQQPPTQPLKLLVQREDPPRSLDLTLNSSRCSNNAESAKVMMQNQQQTLQVLVAKMEATREGDVSRKHC